MSTRRKDGCVLKSDSNINNLRFSLFKRAVVWQTDKKIQHTHYQGPYILVLKDQQLAESRDNDMDSLPFSAVPKKLIKFLF